MTPTISEIEDQKRWEMRWVREGVRRYRETCARADLSTTDHGQWVLNRLIEPVTTAIRLRQRAAHETIERVLETGQAGRPNPADILVQLLAPDVLGYLTIKRLLDAWAAHGAAVCPIQAAEAIGSAARLEYEFELWQEQSKQRHKDDPERPDIARVILTKAKEINPQAFSRWKKKLADIERVSWPKPWRVQLGHELIECAILSGGGWFEVFKAPVAGHMRYRVGLSDAGRELLASIREDVETRRPVLMPTICQPLDWGRVDADPPGIGH